MKKLFIIFFAACAMLCLQAAPLSPEEALKRAVDNSTTKIAARSISDFRLVHTERTGYNATVYLFDSEEGFLVTPADDFAPAVIGYGISKATDQNGELAPGMTYWLSELGRQIEYGINNPDKSRHTVIRRTDREAVGPLTKTKWNQREPYNLMCPPETPPHYPTGCVATAMAQVMKYHNWPECGEGSLAYSNTGFDIAVNFSETVFDWQSMLDEYDADSPQMSCDAVALLMKAVGCSVRMQYRENGSGAASASIGPALGEYFRYDKSLRFLERNFFNRADWEDIIYNSLKNYGPVIYNGQSGTGGHSFVCDGYAGNGFFHFNWGWGGLSDGYFLLDLLDPEHQGIGGADGGFDFAQDIIADIHPDTTGNSQWSYLIVSNEFCDIRLMPEGNKDMITLFSSCINRGPGPMSDAYAGYRLINLDSEASEPIYVMQSLGEIECGHGFDMISLELPRLNGGRYEVTPVYSNGNSREQPILFPVFGEARTILTVTDKNAYITCDVVSLPKFVNAIFPPVIDKNSPVTVKGTLKNSNDTPYLCPLALILLDQSLSSMWAYSPPRYYDLGSSESIDIDLTTNITNISRIPNGYYYLGVALLDFYFNAIPLLSRTEKVMVGYFNDIQQAMAEEPDGLVEYFSLDGTKVASARGLAGDVSLTSGIYIVRTANQTRKVIIK